MGDGLRSLDSDSALECCKHTHKVHCRSHWKVERVISRLVFHNRFVSERKRE